MNRIGSVPIQFVRWQGGEQVTTPRGTSTVFYNGNSVPWGQCVTITGHAGAGWVFTGTDWDGQTTVGDMLIVEGGSGEKLQGFSNDDSNCKFQVMHDGLSPEIIVMYNTRAD